MASILDSLMGSLGGDAIGSISKQVGIPEDLARSAIPLVTNLLTSALTKNASSKKGAQSLTGALSKDHDGSILNDMPGYINNYQKGENYPRPKFRKFHHHIYNNKLQSFFDYQLI